MQVLEANDHRALARQLGEVIVPCVLDLSAPVQGRKREKPRIRSQSSAVGDGRRDALRLGVRKQLTQRRRTHLGPRTAARFENLCSAR